MQKLLLCLLLSGCAAAPLPHTRNLSSVTVTWLRVPASEIQQYCGWGVLGCSRQTSYDTCTVWVAEPKEVKSNHIETLGHEVLHCFIGEFHD